MEMEMKMVSFIYQELTNLTSTRGVFKSYTCEECGTWDWLCI